MNTKARDRILSSIELALGFPARDEHLLAPRDLPSSLRWQDARQPQDDLQREFEALSVRFQIARDLSEAQTAILNILKEHSVRKAIRWEHPLLEALGIDAMLQEAGVQVAPSFPAGQDAFEDIAQNDMGITAADAVLVSSGTLVLRAAPGTERCTSLLPPVHLAIITPYQRLQSVPDLVPLLREWMAHEGRLPSAINLISGPSRTADIELDLVLGAHGPKVVHVLQVDPAWLE